MSNHKSIPVSLNNGKLITLEIFADSPNSLVEIDINDAYLNNESQFQIQEGCFYEYRITSDYCLASSEIVSQSQFNKSAGRLNPNVYVGNLALDILTGASNEKCGEVRLEVTSIKTKYREDYRTMISDIAEKCTELLLQHTSPVTQSFTIDFGKDSKVLYQRFIFIKSILQIDEFREAVQKIISSPIVSWKGVEVQRDIRNIKRVNGKALKQIATSLNRIEIPLSHPLKATLNTVPRELTVQSKDETIDNPENRFVKHVLATFYAFCNLFVTHAPSGSRLHQEAIVLGESIDEYLSHSIFREISQATTLSLNSPVLQRKEGYREVFRTWLLFDLAARLVWHGGDDVYSGGKKDIALLYEYWVYFQLLALVKVVFKIEPKTLDSIIQNTNDGLGLQLRQGKYLAIQGVFQTETRILNVEFSYNRTFTGNNEYPSGGSWTRNLRPDYSLTIWPFGINQLQAESEELIVHLHFDAKYKIDHVTSIFNSDENLDSEKLDQKKGTYKRADLLKMHTYRDAIRRTAGAYILYPGSEVITLQGFHELLPGVGAFALRPSRSNSGSPELVNFLRDVVAHFLNRASQREAMSFRTYDVHKYKPGHALNGLLPETIGINRGLLPDQTFVLVAYYKSPEHLNWILANRMYNARVGNHQHPLRLGSKEVGANYLLLHTKGDAVSGKLFTTTDFPRIFSKEDLLKKKYPEPSQDHYLVYSIEPCLDREFAGKVWHLRKLNGYATGRASALPFTVSVAELMESSGGN